jgi:hypothetical protein
MNFDCVTDELENPVVDAKTRDCIRRLSGLGAKFQHLSYTTYSGFNLNCRLILYFLKQAEVKSIRLTMDKGSPINEPEPMMPVKPLLNDLERLELIGSMTPPRSLLDKLFPQLSYYNYSKQNLAGAPVQQVC